ncbi:cold-shock protein [Wolbachia endosymbiont of Pentidionis agamae]|uniref:cold-shock protein n=1 Tax=Wolbachia endosymbiont of Pentidionis agamae TaxID=3110435 RepID=UPI002FD12F32
MQYKFEQKQELKGNIKWFSSVKGYGFIKPGGGGDDIFFHATGLESSIKSSDEIDGNKGVNKRVSYSVKDDKKKGRKFAENIKLLDDND